MDGELIVSDSSLRQIKSALGGFFVVLLSIILPFCVSKFISSKKKAKPSAVRAESSGKNEIIMRNIRFPDLVEVPWEGATTITALFEQSCKKYARCRCLGTRKLISREFVQSDGKKLEKLHLGEYQWKTYAETLQCVMDFASGLVKIGHKSERRAAILSETRAEWFISFQGCLRGNISVVTVYASLGEDAIIHALNETRTTTLICDSQQLTKLGGLSSRLETLENVIYFEDDLTPSGFQFSGSISRFKVVSFSEVMKLGRMNVKCVSPDKDDVAMIMYTSGSTGLPKGVLITHRSFVATVAGLILMLPRLQNQVYLAYLPLAHVFELIAENIALTLGSAIGYGSPLTLMDSSSRIKTGTRGDASELRPTFMTSVPAVLDRVKDGVLRKVNSKGGLAKKLFHLAYNRRLEAIEGSWFGAWGLERMLWEFLVFEKIRALLGGRVWYLLCAGAPLSGDAQRFIEICLGAHVAVGYGLTETCAGATCSEEDDASVGRVGPPIPSCLIKLESWEEGGYRVSDKPIPRGEIAVGGFGITAGYLNNKGKTEEVYKVDGNGMWWFYTGDIGQFHPDGVMEIIDRKKDIIKLQHGEYISLGQIESVLVSSHYIDRSMVHADPLHSYCVALVVPLRDVLEDWARTSGLEFRSFVELCGMAKAVEEVKRDILQTGKEAKLNKYETPAEIRLLPESWTPETGLVTASMKLKREEIKARFREELKGLYS